MSQNKLSPAQRSHLKSLGHHLTPLVTVGKDGITDGVVDALKQALLDHELVKVKLGKSSTEDRHDVAEPLAERAKAHNVSLTGKTMLLYKRHPEKPTIKLPK
ncbi:MAG: ribosome assembly RNA-binding protein YhbY [Myxococcales bacterium]|nr:ribosome assembly RNA-binding protein YhbY [Myxococcales bacterium]